MNKKSLLILVCILSLAGAASAQISIPWSRYTPPKIDLTGQGARALGMGGAFIGLADDATAISWNPAGLAQLDRPEISFVGRFDRASSGFEEKSTSIGTLDPDKSRTHFAFNFASVVFPLKVKERNLAIALAAKQELDMFRVNEVHEPDYYDYTESWSGDVYTASLGLAYQVTPQMALGGAFHYWTGSPGAAVSLYDYNTQTTEAGAISEPYSGYNASLGGWGQFKPFKFGAVLHTPLALKYHNEYSGAFFANANVPPRIPGSGDWNFKWPFLFGLGAAVEPTRNLTFAADLDVRPFSSATLDSGGVKDTSAVYENLTQFRLGAEYLLMFGTAIIPIRAGYRTDPRLYTGTVVDSSFNLGSDGKQVKGNVFTFGTGYVSKRFQLDGALEYGVTKEPLIWDPSFGKTPSTWNWREKTIRVLVSGIVRF